MQLACWVLLAGATSMVGWVFCRMAAAAFRALYEPPALVLHPPRRRACVSALVPVALCPGVHAAATEARRRSRAGGGGGRGNMRVGRVGGVAVAAARLLRGCRTFCRRLRAPSSRRRGGAAGCACLTHVAALRRDCESNVRGAQEVLTASDHRVP